MPLSELAETLARIEHKLDFVIRRQDRIEMAMGLQQGIKPQLGEMLTCPVCTQPIKHQVDVLKKIIVRKCGCKTGLIPPLNLDALAPAVAQRKDQDHGEREDPEDRRDPHPGGRSRRR